MALNSSGPISLGGSTVGQSINLELGQSATAQASMNATNFRTLAGVASGQISISNFYGKSNITGWFGIYQSTIPASSTYNSARGVVVDGSNNLYVIATTNNNAALLKISSTGSLTAQKQYTNFNVDATGDYVCNMLLDGSGNIYAYTSNAKILKADSSFAYSAGRASKGWTTAATSIYSLKLTKDSSGNLFAYMYSSDDCGNGACQAQKYNSSLVAQGSPAQFGSYTTGPNGSIAVDGSDNIYVFADSGQDDANKNYLVKYNSSLTFQWSRRLSETQQGYGVMTSAVDSSGNSYLVGTGTGTCTIMKVNTSGTLQWARKLVPASSYGGKPHQVIVGGDGFIYICGTVPLSVYNYYIGWIAKYNSSGVLQWQREIANSTAGVGYGAICGIAYTSGGLAIAGNVKSNGAEQGNSLIGYLPLDGAGTGTYNLGGVSVVYRAGTFTESAYTITLSTITYDKTWSFGNNNSTISSTASTPTVNTSVANLA